MLNYHLITASRNLRKNKIFSIINIIGLSIGISAALVIFIVVSHDFSFDKFQKDNDRIYHVVTDVTVLGETNHLSGVTYPMPAAIKNEVSGVESIIHLYTIDRDEDTKVSVPVTGTDEPVVFRSQKDIAFVDRSYFDLMSYKWMAGSQQTAVEGVHQTVLTESIAQLYYPNQKPSDIIGKKIIFNDTLQANITGIVANPDHETDFNFKIFISKPTLELRLLGKEEQTKWGGANSSSQLFIKISKDKSPAQITSLLNDLYKKYRKPGRLTFAVSLQPLNNLHFDTIYTPRFIKRVAHKPTLYGLMTVAVFLLVLGCINFINLTTAQGSHRAKEIGIRKSMGSSKKQLITQFLGEAFLLTLIAALLSLAIAPWLLKVFGDFIPEELHFNLTLGIVAFLLMIVIVVSLLSGFYPALILSSFKPVSTLKNQVTTGNQGNLWLWKTFTVSQFVIAQVFVIGTIIVSKQLSYTLNKDLGFKKMQLFTCARTAQMPTHQNVLFSWKTYGQSQKLNCSVSPAILLLLTVRG